jgi:uncharacterized DUF497 family protein
MGLVFEWDPNKAIANLAKHGVSFDEAKTVFGDPDELMIYDEEHSDEEDRYVSMGMSIRIISARAANKRERKQYEETG